MAVPRELAGTRQPGTGACLEPSFRLAQLVLERRDPLADAVDGLGTDGRRRSLEGVETPTDELVGGAPGRGFDAAHAGADAPLGRDQEAADLAGGPGVRAAAQLEAVVLDTDGPDRLAVLLVEEGVRASLDRLSHAHERDGDGPVLPNDAVDLVLDRVELVDVSPRSNGKSKRR